MKKNSKNQPSNEAVIVLGMSIGIVIGAVIGDYTGNVPLSVSLGTSFGMASGCLYVWCNSKRNSRHE